MSKQTINIGASPNDGTGTPLRTSFDYTNQNFTELYTALGGGVGLPGATTQVIFNDGGTNLAGDAGLVYNKTTDALTVAGLVTAGSATITGAATVGTTLGVTGVSTLTGNVGIGVTPGAWSSDTKAIQLGGSTFSAFAANVRFLGLANALYDGTNYKYLNTGSALQYRMSGGTGTHEWYNAASGTAGNNITFTQAMTLDGDGNLSLALGNVVMATSGKGIDFSATANSSGTMTSELLNDYEEGTWTIGLTFGGGNTGLTTALNTGRYTKIGRQVTVCGRLELSNKGSSTGAAVITGLPFAVGSGNDSQQAASFRFNGVSYTGAFQGYGTAGSTTIPLEQISEAGSPTDITNSNFSNATSIQISLTYTV